ncbi:MAG: DUF4386 family protein [Actinomycetota bacterium]|nr:DUF4386 family protein [Actinomycetota bacterium]
MSVALVRFMLPYYTANDSLATVRSVYAHPARQSAVVWLGLIAVLTLVPGVLAVASALPPSRLKSWAVGLSVPGYLCLSVLLAEDYLLSAGASAHTAPRQLAAQLDGIHPSFQVGTAIFVLGHVVGTVLLGVALLRSGRIPAWAAWTITVSQPLHFVATVILGSPTLDLFAWSMTAVGMGVVARVLITELSPAERELDRV